MSTFNSDNAQGLLRFCSNSNYSVIQETYCAAQEFLFSSKPVKLTKLIHSTHSKESWRRIRESLPLLKALTVILSIISGAPSSRAAAQHRQTSRGSPVQHRAGRAQGRDAFINFAAFRRSGRRRPPDNHFVSGIFMRQKAHSWRCIVPHPADSGLSWFHSIRLQGCITVS